MNAKNKKGFKLFAEFEPFSAELVLLFSNFDINMTKGHAQN
jgi:hypothetical protein